MADELRGAVGGWEFKAYVLGTLFYRFISENLTDYINNLQREAGVEGFDYADMNDDEAEAARAQMVQEKGFFILPSQLFATVAKTAIVEIETTANQSVCALETNEDIINYKFLYYYLANNYFKIKSSAQGALTSLNLAMIKGVLVPVPPITDQKYYVDILDTFTAVIDNIKKQIRERQKQFEYYRNYLLDFKGNKEVEMVFLKDLFTFKNGLNKGKEYFGTGKPIIMFTNVFNYRQIKASMIKSRVNITKQELERIDARGGDVFFTRTSETKEEVGYASVLIDEIDDCTFAGFLIRARPFTNKLIPEYCKYCFSTPTVREKIVCNSSFTTRASLTGSGLGKVCIPVPAIKEQKRIVGILDNFEKVISNLEQQLVKRQKQYEYYRNKLLTFE